MTDKPDMVGLDTVAQSRLKQLINDLPYIRRVAIDQHMIFEMGECGALQTVITIDSIPSERHFPTEPEMSVPGNAPKHQESQPPEK